MMDRKLLARLLSAAAICAIVALPLQGYGAPPEGKGKGKTHNQGKADDKGRHVGQQDNRGKHGANMPGENRGKHGQNKPGNDRGRHIGQTDNRGKHLGQLKHGMTKGRVDKDDWGEIARVAGMRDVAGRLKNDRTLVFSGSNGALYSMEKYRSDLKSKDKVCRLRATYFSKTKFYRDGRRYERKKVMVKQKAYYRFVRR